MRTRRFEQLAPTRFFVAGCAAFFGAFIAIGHAQAQAPPPWVYTVPAPQQPIFNPSSPYTVPQPRYTPISPATPGTLPGAGARSGWDGSSHERSRSLSSTGNSPEPKETAHTAAVMAVLRAALEPTASAATFGELLSQVGGCGLRSESGSLAKFPAIRRVRQVSRCGVTCYGVRDDTKSICVTLHGRIRHGMGVSRAVISLPSATIAGEAIGPPDQAISFRLLQSICWKSIVFVQGSESGSQPRCEPARSHSHRRAPRLILHAIQADIAEFRRLRHAISLVSKLLLPLGS